MIASDDGKDRIPYTPAKDTELDMCIDENGDETPGLTYEGELNKVTREQADEGHEGGGRVYLGSLPRTTALRYRLFEVCGKGKFIWNGPLPQGKPCVPPGFCCVLCFSSLAFINS